MATFEQTHNWNEVFLRDVTIGLTSELYRKIRWFNRWQNGETKLITVPFYYSMTGDDRFLLDAFVDDIPGQRPELNIDPVPRAVIELASWGAKKSEFTNPNVDIIMHEERDGELQQAIGKYRIIPMRMSYSIDIYLASEGDVFKCSQSILDWLWAYKHFYIDYKSMRIDAAFYIPDEQSTEIERTIAGLSGDNAKHIKFNVDVHTYYPVAPIKNKPIPINKKVRFKGNMWEGGLPPRGKNFLGDSANEIKNNRNKR